MISSRAVSRRHLLRSGVLGIGTAILVSACGTTSTTTPSETSASSATSAPENVKAATTAPSTSVAAAVNSSSTGKVDLAFWYGWTGTLGDACKALAKSYSKAHPNVSFSTLEHGWQGDKILTAFAGGNPPDVLEWFSVEFALRGALRPLDDLVRSSSVVKLDNYFDVMLKAETFDGKLYAIPAIEQFAELGLGMNTKLVQEAGLDPKKPPETWEELMVWGDKLTKKDSSGLTQVGFDPLDGVAAWQDTWANSYGFYVYDADKQTFVDAHDKWVDIFTQISEYLKKWGPDQFVAFRKAFGRNTEVTPTSSWCHGQEALIVNGYWAVPLVKLDCPPGLDFTYSWAPVSKDRKGAKMQRIAGHSVVLPKDSKKASDAWGFVESLTTDNACQVTYDAAGDFVGTKSWLKKIDATRYPGLDWYVKSANDNTELYNSPMIPETEQTQDWQNALDSVIYGQKSAKQAVDTWYGKLSELEKKASKSAPD